MTYVLELATDNDIRNTMLHQRWQPVVQRYRWDQVAGMELRIPGGVDIVVIAHGNNDSIGNANDNDVCINPETFLAVIQGNMAENEMPNAVYISACGEGLALFTASVRIAAKHNRIWLQTRLFGHCDPVSGDVPHQNDIRWTQIY